MRSRLSQVALVGIVLSAPVIVLAACESEEGASAPLVDGGLGPAVDAPPTGITPDGADSDSAVDGAVVLSRAIVQLSAGQQHTCARRASGRVTCWGHNFYGQLGSGQKSDDAFASPPQDVQGLDDAVQISAGHGRTCALRATGVVVCWGNGNSIGNGATAEVLVPTPVFTSLDAGTPLTDVVEIHGGWYGYSCARKSNGTVTCWGADNAYGSNGDGTTDPRREPNVDVVGLTDAVELVKGEKYACARRATGAVVCWGFNVNGQLGSGTGGTPSPVPVSVSAITDATALGIGQQHTCARRGSGVVSCWGTNNNGQLGNGDDKLSNATPVNVSGLTDAKQLVGGSTFSCALRETGGVACWGSNVYGQLGDGTTDMRLTPVAVSGLTDAVEIVAGPSFACARRATGAVVCWGANNKGETGDVTKFEHHTPHEVPGL